MTIDVASVDAALTTTRAVRLRLDLERPVDNDIIYDCIDIAEQAPTGGNQGSRRWIIVRDPQVKARIAELYMATGGQFMLAARDRLAGSGLPQERTMRSAAHLAEHLAEVPAIVIPTIIGRHDGSGRPGLFDSVIQSVWSFCVALRARGLGSAWTTAVLAKDAELADLLGVPPGNTQIAMIPVAWTVGTDFARAPRLPAREISFIDHYAHTWVSGPSDPPCLADGPGTVVEVDIDAKPADVWPFVVDIDFGAAYSEEFRGARWADGVDGPALGATFIGSNVHPRIGEWDVPCFVHRYVEGAEFGWVTSDPDNPGAQWRFELVPIAGATRLRYSLVLGPGPSGINAAIAAMPDKEPRILHRRVEEHRANMQRVVEGIKAAVESAGG
ncbi:MAG TPA: nitroreductase family protein [Ilumatobacter sp.]